MNATDCTPVLEDPESKMTHTALVAQCEKELGIVPDGFDDEKTWELFSSGKYVCPFFDPEYRACLPRPNNIDELAEYVGRGFFIKQDFTVSMLCFSAFNGIKKENRLRFREDLDAFFESVFNIPHDEAQKILRDLRNPVREERGKQELHALCTDKELKPSTENILYQEIISTRPTLSKRPVAYAYAKLIYKIAYFQANYPEAYERISLLFSHKG